MGTQRPSSSADTPGPIPISELLDAAVNRLTRSASTPNGGDGFLYTGNRVESVPRALFFDHRLTPLERNAWQVIRMMLSDDGLTAFPTYEQLRPLLTSVPCSGRASDETIARALSILRVTRWLTLILERRDPASGRMLGNVYLLHDEPLTPYEAIRLDPCYLELVSKALTHASKAIQQVGNFALTEIADDTRVSGRVLPSRLQVLIHRMSAAGLASAEPPSESEDGENTDKNPLRNPKTDSTVRTPIYKDPIRTVQSTTDPPHLLLPDAFRRLRNEQQTGALIALQQVERVLQQPVLDEWAARCRTTKVRKPAGYLFGIISKALRGEFRAWVSEQASGSLTPTPSATTTPQPAPVQSTPFKTSEQHIADLRAMLRGIGRS